MVQKINGLGLVNGGRRIFNDDWHVQNVYAAQLSASSAIYTFRPRSYIRIRRIMLQGFFFSVGPVVVTLPSMLQLTISPGDFITPLDELSLQVNLNLGNLNTTLYFSPSAPGINVDWIMHPGTTYTVNLATVDPLPGSNFFSLSHNFEWQLL